MKNKWFLGLSLLAAAGLWTGCSKEEVGSESSKQPISFRLQGGAPAMRTTGTGLAHVDAFVVYGTDNSNDFGGSDEFIFEGISVVRQQDNSFDYSPKRFYGENSNRSVYFAYSPVNATVNGLDITTMMPAVSSSDITGKFAYTLPKPNTSGLVTQQDLLLSAAQENVVHNSSGSNTVSFNFKHALSRIFVTATNATLKDGDAIVTNLTLKNLFCKANILFDTSKSLNSVWNWDDWVNREDLEYVLAEKGVVVPSNTTNPIWLTSKEQGMMVIPQETVNTNDDTTVDQNDFYLEVKYNLGNLKNQTKNILFKDKFTFEAGKQYSMNIKFTGTLIEFTMIVTDWVDGGTVTPPTNNP